MSDELPEGWALVQFRDIAVIKGGITKGQKRSTADVLRKVPYLRVANVQRGYLNLDEIKEIEATEDEIADLRLLLGDILLIEGGNREHLGRGWIWQGEIAECIHQNHIFRARLRNPKMEARYFSWYANHIGQAYFHAEASQTVNLASINLRKLRVRCKNGRAKLLPSHRPRKNLLGRSLALPNPPILQRTLSSLPVAVPPLAEQKRVVRKIAELLSAVAAATDRLRKAASLIGLELVRAGNDLITQAILAKAFRGQLVPTEAELARREGRDYEPASALLERMRAARGDAADMIRASGSRRAGTKPKQMRRTPP